MPNDGSTSNSGSSALPLLLPGALNVLAMIAKLQPDLVTPAKVLTHPLVHTPGSISCSFVHILY